MYEQFMNQLCVAWKNILLLLLYNFLSLMAEASDILMSAIRNIQREGDFIRNKPY